MGLSSLWGLSGLLGGDDMVDMVIDKEARWVTGIVVSLLTAADYQRLSFIGWVVGCILGHVDCSLLEAFGLAG